MTIADDRPTVAPVQRAIPLAPASPTDGERAPRATLREQIARLENRLATETPDGRVAAAQRPAVTRGPRVLDLGDLERVRDDLAARVEAARGATAARERVLADRRALRTAMYADPDAHRGVTLTAADLGEPGCTRWSVRPVLGLVGRLAGWWRVRVSSGCP